MDGCYASNWCIFYVRGKFDFNEICYTVLKEFPTADVIKIEKDKQLIRLRLDSVCNYLAVMSKFESCFNQILLDIDLPEEKKANNNNIKKCAQHDQDRY